MGYNLFFCPPCEWQASVYSTKPSLQASMWHKSAVHMDRLALTLHLLSLPSFPTFTILPLLASLCRPQLSSFTCSQCPLSVLLLERAQGRSQTLLGFTRGRERERGSVLYPAVSLCLCCFTPAAARHQARLLQLTLNYKNNGLLCNFLSSNTLQTKL